jgi:hypothetical protein
MQQRSEPRAERAHLRRVEPADHLDSLADWLDSRFAVPGVGWRFGLDPLIGLIPGIGDLVPTLFSLYILFTAVSMGVPKITLTRMAMNVALDFALGSLPVVGDLFDAWFKANRRNVSLIREARIRGEGARRALFSDWLYVAGVGALLLFILAGAIALTWAIVGALFSGLGNLFAPR